MGTRMRADRHDIETDRFLTEPELARRWRISPRTLQRWRWRGLGPAHLAVGRRILYRLTDIEAFERRHLRGGDGGAADPSVSDVEGDP